MKQIAPSVLNTVVSGLNLTPGLLSDQLSAQTPTLLVFLRHFG